MGHATTTVNNKILIVSTQELDWGSYDDSIYAIDVNSRQIIAKDFMGRYSSSGTQIGDNVFFAPDYDYVIKYNITSNTFIRGAVGQIPLTSNCIFLGNNIMYLTQFDYEPIVKTDISNFASSVNQAIYELPNPVSNSPTLFGGMLIIADNKGQLYCLNEDLKYLRWVFKTPSQINSSAIIDSTTDNVFVGCNDMNMYAINYVNGALRWKFPTAGIIKSSPVLYNHNIYFASFDKFLYCVNVHTGKLTWKYNLNCIVDAQLSIVSNDLKFYPSTSGSKN